MWIMVLLSSLCSLSRFKFGLLYTIWRALVVVFFQNRVSRQDDHSCRKTRETSHIKFLLAINLIYF